MNVISALNNPYKQISLFLINLLFVSSITAESLASAEKPEEPPALYNFALSASQQPGPFISFGQNIIDKGQLQLFLGIAESRGEQNHSWETSSSLLYGLTDTMSLSVGLPYSLTEVDGENHSAGIEDLPIQFEYAFYTANTSSYSDTFTLVTNITLPTGSDNKDPATGFGSPSFFIGTTLNRSYPKWFEFSSFGTIQTTPSHPTTYGNEYLYQFGVGHNFYSHPSSLIIAGLMELNGSYTEKDRNEGVVDPNSGGNVVFVTPSIWISTPKLIVQVGAGQAVLQKLNGTQNKNGYVLSAIFGWIL